MKIIIGLGNPGEKFKLTRHNIGFAIIDKIAENFSVTKWVKKFNGLYCECRSQDHKFSLLKPETYMNNSGQSVLAAVNFFKLNVKDLIIIHDDLDLEVGEIKVKASGGHAGHNGLKSIHQVIGDQYVRVRIGIGRPEDKSKVSSYVLSNFSKLENIQMNTYKQAFLLALNPLLKDDQRTFIDYIKQ